MMPVSAVTIATAETSRMKHHGEDHQKSAGLDRKYFEKLDFYIH
jgi:hypothetical protein